MIEEKNITVFDFMNNIFHVNELEKLVWVAWSGYVMTALLNIGMFCFFGWLGEIKSFIGELCSLIWMPLLLIVNYFTLIGIVTIIVK